MFVLVLLLRLPRLRAGDVLKDSRGRDAARATVQPLIAEDATWLSFITSQKLVGQWTDWARRQRRMYATSCTRSRI